MAKAVIPNDIKVVAFATGVRWLGWGFCEALVPVLIYSLSRNFSESGLLFVVDNIVFLLFFPLVGMLVDKVNIKRFLVWSLLLFLFSGAGFIVAALTRHLWLIVVTSVFSGLAVACDLIGRSTYVRRYAPRHTVASTFGFSDTVVNGGQLIGIMLGALVAPYLSLPYMFIFVFPTTLITMAAFALFLKPVDISQNVSKERVSSIKETWSQLRLLKAHEWLLGLSLFLLNLLISVAFFFLPIMLKTEGATNREVLLASMVYYVPFTFSFLLGKLADRREHRVLRMGWFVLGVAVYILSLVSGKLVFVGIAFLMLSLVSAMSLAIDSLVTKIVDPLFYGRLGSLFEALKQLGIIAGPLVLGLLLDSVGQTRSFAIMSTIVFAFALCYLFSGSKIVSKEIVS